RTGTPPNPNALRKEFSRYRRYVPPGSAAPKRTKEGGPADTWVPYRMRPTFPGAGWAAVAASNTLFTSAVPTRRDHAVWTARRAGARRATPEPVSAEVRRTGVPGKMASWRLSST